MSGYYEGEPRHLVAIDCVIFGFDRNKLKLLLVKRTRPPQRGHWSLMGGFLSESETLEEAAQRILTKLTGLENVYLEQFHTFSDIYRDPGERVLSVAFYALLKIDESDMELAQSYGAAWVDINDRPPLIFDHEEMVDMALSILRHKCRVEPVGFELMPEKFTIPQLQKLYEAILGVSLDNANFRKKILSMKILEKLTEKEKGGSKKGAYYYRFDKEKFDTFNNE